MENLSDQELVQKYFDGDQQAFEFLVQKYLQPVYNFVFKYVHTEEAAEDVTQEAFIKIWKNIAKYNSKYKFKTWAFTIAKNTALDHLRKKSIIPLSSFEDPEALLDSTLTNRELISDQAMQKVEDMQMIAHAVKDLPEKYRQVISLYYEKELNFREISELLKQSINTIKTKHRRALDYLRRKLPKN